MQALSNLWGSQPSLLVGLLGLSHVGLERTEKLEKWQLGNGGHP